MGMAESVSQLSFYDFYLTDFIYTFSVDYRGFPVDFFCFPIELQRMAICHLETCGAAVGQSVEISSAGIWIF
jgi:hypothetical protein